MRILWLDINSSYSHSSVALPAIHSQVSEQSDWKWCVVRGTIHDNPSILATAVANYKPDVIASTFWLFTHQMQIEVLSRAEQLLDGVKIICGGPEFLGSNEAFLRIHLWANAVIRGEGEQALPALLRSISQQENWSQIEGLCWISDSDGSYHDNGTARVADFAGLRYPEESSLFSWDKPFVQLETTRGCFNTCAFCVSGGEKPVRYQSIGQVRSRLENICAHGIKDVRVLDRTFNYDTERACEMLDLFAQYAGKMRFHLEIHPSLLSDRIKEKLSTLPQGLLHLEAGIQSLHSKVLDESGRKGSLASSLEGLKYLCSLDNIQTHADLIAGLPAYSLEMLSEDVAELISIGVDELQVESLKVLPGTQMRLLARDKGLKYSPLPPYEVLQTPDISPDGLVRAMQISRMVDLYYNAPVWQDIIRKLVCNKRDFIIQFTGYLNEKMVLDTAISIERRGVLLYDYCLEYHPEVVTEVSIAWIEAGFSLKKRPAGKTTKIKNLESFLSEHQVSPIYGLAASSHRYNLFLSTERAVLFGYESENQQATPAYMADVINY